jgi:hypothetical protein
LKWSHRYLILWVIIPLVLFALYSFQNKKPEAEKEISYTEFFDMVSVDKLERLQVSN